MPANVFRISKRISLVFAQGMYSREGETVRGRGGVSTVIARQCTHVTAYLHITRRALTTSSSSRGSDGDSDGDCDSVGGVSK